MRRKRTTINTLEKDLSGRGVLTLRLLRIVDEPSIETDEDGEEFDENSSRHPFIEGHLRLVV